MHVAMRFVPSFEELRFDDARRRIAAPFPPASGGPHVAGSAPAASRDSARTVAPPGPPLQNISPKFPPGSARSLANAQGESFDKLVRRFGLQGVTPASNAEPCAWPIATPNIAPAIRDVREGGAAEIATRARTYSSCALVSIVPDRAARTAAIASSGEAPSSFMSAVAQGVAHARPGRIPRLFPPPRRYARVPNREIEPRHSGRSDRLLKVRNAEHRAFLVLEQRNRDSGSPRLNRREIGREVAIPAAEGFGRTFTAGTERHSDGAGPKRRSEAVDAKRQRGRIHHGKIMPHRPDARASWRCHVRARCDILQITRSGSPAAFRL